MESKNLDGKIANILKEDVGNVIPQTDFTDEDLKNIITLSNDVEDEEGSLTDILYDPDNKEMIEFKMKGEEVPSLNFIPLADFKPEVYGLSDDVFDKVAEADKCTCQDTIEEPLVELPDDDEEFEPEYEEKAGFEAGKKFADTEEEDDDDEVTEKDFEDIDDETLLEYVYSKGMSFINRRDAINKLFEYHKVTKDELKVLKESVRKQKINEEITLMESDEFINKWGSDLDFRGIEDVNKIGTEESDIYNALNNMDEEEWEEYQNDLMTNGTSVSYDSVNDVFIFTPSGAGIEDEDEIIDEELYEVEQEDKTIIENIIKQTSFILKEVKGLPKSTGRAHILEIIVEKDNHETTIQYNDNKNIKPWSIKEKEFNTLTESLDNIFIPFKKLVNDSREANKKVYKGKTFLEEVRKENFNKTKNLPLLEQEIRAQRSLELIKEMFDEDVNEEDEYLTELKKYKKEND